MVITLHTTRVYRIDDVDIPRRLLLGLPMIVDSPDILVFSSYESRPDIARFLHEHALPVDEIVDREVARLSLYKDEYPNALACGLYADPHMLEQLATIINNLAEPSELCDHLFGYCQRGPLLAFHDAFKSDPLYVSSIVPEARVASFCSWLGKPYLVQDNPFAEGTQAQEN